MARFWIGTSGWNYKHWRERFYPHTLPSRDWLAFYAERFPTVELNYSYYQQPSAANWRTWRENSPPGFRFAVKAHRFLTHLRRLTDPEEPLKLVLEGAVQLGPTLGPILYQLPPSFKATPEHVRRLTAFVEMLPGEYLHTVEFRDRSWFGDDTVDLLRRHNVAYCSFDRGQLTSPLVATTSFAYMRFHGPGDEPGGNYTQDHLTEWAARLESLSGEVDDIFVYFNNDAFGYALSNAVTLGRLLGVTVERPLLATARR
jgi:uncharacterized protein YecE (DUF72 family)